MASFNKVILAGNLTRDPELRYTPKGTALVKLGMAISRTWKSESGEKREEVTFVDVDVWDRQAEVIAQYFRKGRPILVEGRLQLDTWEDKTTHEKRSKLKVRLESFSFLESKGAEDAGAAAGAVPSGEPARRSPPAAPAKPAAAPPESGPPDGEPPPEEDDVPF
jgi:single-strand DNA-binding protein